MWCLGLGYCWGADKDSKESSRQGCPQLPPHTTLFPALCSVFSTVHSHQNALPLLEHSEWIRSWCGQCCSKPLQQQVARASTAPGRKAESVGQVYVGRQTNSVLEERQSRIMNIFQCTRPLAQQFQFLEFILSQDIRKEDTHYYKSKKQWAARVVIHAFNPSTLRQRQEDHCGFETSLIHTENSRVARTNHKKEIKGCG